MPSDHWTGPVVCVHCGTRRDEVYIATGVLDSEGRNVRVGAAVDVERGSIAPADYLPLHVDRSGSELRLLEVWWCESCARNRWAEIVVRDGVFTALAAVALTPEALDRADFIATFDLRDVYSGWTNVMLFPDDDWRKPPRPDWQELLRAFLAEHPQ